VGENGVGKSTLIEGIAALAGFDDAGGSRDHRPVDHSTALETSGTELATALKAAWRPKIGGGWFFKAETFFSVARYLDDAAMRSPSRQIEFLKLLRRMERSGVSQVIMATHAPILMAYPGARLLRMHRRGLEPVRLEDTDHYRLLREFCADPATFVDTMLET
jgi:predicted ATPase